jgi:hypothetical protein
MRVASKDRKSAVADAGIDLLAKTGNLTHRAVDRALGIPMGSTANLFSTRAALLLACAERLVSLDLEAISAVPDFSASPTPRAAGERLAATLAAWTAGPARDRQRARWALLLQAGREDAVTAMLFRVRADFVAVAIAGLRAAGSGAPEQDGPALVAFVDGLLLDRVLYDDVAVDETQLTRHLVDFVESAVRRNPETPSR